MLRGAALPRPRRPGVLGATVALAAVMGCSEALPTAPDYVDCSRFAPTRSAVYVLPYPVDQGFRVSRTFEHYTPANGGVGTYAVDFAMPIGTAVHAIRAGTVVAVEERFSDDDHADFHENWVMVRHADDSVARYVHLTMAGASVAVGDRVTQGQLVGRSGNSGASTGPHLHLDVQTCGPNLPPGYNQLPCGQTLPLSFRNTDDASCGLVAGRTYRARAFAPDVR